MAKKGANGLLPAVPERRVANVVRQGSRRHNGAKIVEAIAVRLHQMRMLFKDFGPGHPPQAAAHHGNLQAVGKAGVHEIGLGKRDHLGLVLQTPEIGRKYDPVVIYLKAQAGRVLLPAQAFVRIPLSPEGQQALPLHHIGGGLPAR
jgi:hypothetical protein